MKKFCIIVLFFLFSIFQVFAYSEAKILPSITAQVVSVDYVDSEDNDFINVKQVAEVKILEGEQKNSLIILDNMLTGNPFYDIRLSDGMKVLLHAEEVDGQIIYSVENVKRSNILMILLIIFGGLLLYVGRKKGLFSLVSIVITVFLIFKMLTPMILLGINPVFATLLICFLSTASTIYLVGGFNMKSTSATLGTLLSLVCAGLLSFLSVRVADLNGLVGEQSLFLYTTHPELSFVSIIISTMIIATLGAVMDVGMSIASTINEIYEVDNTKTVRELFVSGMNVGKDIIGTMANTLILVYLGTSLPLIILVSNIDLQKFINLNQVVTEIASALIGSISIVICVPITAYVSAKLIKIKQEKYDFFNN